MASYRFGSDSIVILERLTQNLNKSFSSLGRVSALTVAIPITEAS